jgi:hypothetical protein
MHITSLEHGSFSKVKQGDLARAKRCYHARDHTIPKEDETPPATTAKEPHQNPSTP